MEAKKTKKTKKVKKNFIVKTYKNKLIPTKSQVKKLEMMLEVHRVLYNSAWIRHEEIMMGTGLRPNWYEDKKWLTSLCQQFGYFKQCNRNSLDETLKKLNAAEDRYWYYIKCKKAGVPMLNKDGSVSKVQEVGPPKRKKKHQVNSFVFTRQGNGYRVKPVGDGKKRTQVHISGVGNIRMWCDRKLEGELKTGQIIREGKNWYFCVTSNIKPVEKTSSRVFKGIGIDLGLSHFAITNEGTYVPNPRYLKNGKFMLEGLDYNISNKYNIAEKEDGRRFMSNNYKRLRSRQKKVNIKIRNQRGNFIHKLTKDLVSDYSFIAIEDLSITKMLSKKDEKGEKSTRVRDHHRDILDTSWSKFVECLKYKCKEAGTTLVMVNPYNTTIECNSCGNLVPKDLNERKHICPECGFNTCRDLNAAKNIYDKGIKVLSGNGGKGDKIVVNFDNPNMKFC